MFGIETLGKTSLFVGESVKGYGGSTLLLICCGDSNIILVCGTIKAVDMDDGHRMLMYR